MKYLRFIIPILLSAVILASCASAPEETEGTEAVVLTVDEARAAAETAREEAEEVHAPKAAADEFSSAQSFYDEAGNATNQDDAVDLYVKAADGFRAATATATEAREAAVAAMAEADKVISDSETAADEAVQAVKEEE